MGHRYEVETEYAVTDMGAAEAEKRAGDSPAAWYRALAVFVLLFTVGGLFLGMLGEWISFLRPSAYFDPSEEYLPGSVMGYVIAYFKQVFLEIGFASFFSDMIKSGAIETYVEFALFWLLCLAVLLSVILAVIAFVSRTSAKNCAMTALVFSLLAYGGMFIFWLYVYGKAAFPDDAFTAAMFDVPTGLTAAALLVCLLIAALARRKGTGLLNFILLLLTLATVFALIYPGSLTLIYTSWALTPSDTSEASLFINIASLVLLAVVLFNIVASVIRTTAKQAYAFDAVRYGVLLVAVALLTAAFIVGKTGGSRWAIFTDQLLPSVLMLAAPFAAFLLAIILTIYKSSKARSEEAEEEARGIGSGFVPAGYPVAPEAPAAAAPAPSPVSAAPAAAQTSYQSAAVPTQGMPVVQPATPVYAMPFFAAPIAPVVQPPPVQPAPAPETPAAVSAAVPSAPARTAAEDSPMSEFERSMAALARGIAPEAPAPAPSAPAPASAAPVPFAAHGKKGAPVRAPQPAAAQPAAYDASQYLYDAFINSLTPREKNEFGDLFIANKYGDLAYLPAYVIGGDNSEFFSKIFIYLGKFRRHISSELLDKVYSYVSRN